MHPIIYDVAVTLDGYISGPDGDISCFPPEGAHAEAYFQRLAGYAACVMGRATYEFGYRYGLKPGENPYPHMETLVISTTLALPAPAAVTCVASDLGTAIEALRARATGPVYLCGGGQLAGWMLTRGMIDRLILKRAPAVLGHGTPLFTGGTPTGARLTNRTPYASGVVLEEYELKPD